MEVKHCEKRYSDIALDEINQEFESQRLHLQRANQWADQAQRDKISLYGQVEMRIRFFRENQAKDCQELRRICCEETYRTRQARIDELSKHRERNPTTVSQLLTQIQDLQNKVNSLSEARELYDPETASSQSTPYYSESRIMPCRDSGLPHDTRNIVGTVGNLFERVPARLFNNSKNLASSSQELRPDIAGNTKRPESERSDFPDYDLLDAIIASA